MKQSNERINESCCAKEEENAVSAVEYNVAGMDCPSCADTIEKSLMKEEGIRKARVNYGSGKLSAEVESSLNSDHIPSHLKKLGFHADPIEDSKSMETYRVDGMDCGSCADTIEKHLLNHPAVNEVRVNFSTGRMQVAHETTEEVIRKEVEKSGFQAALEGGQKEEQRSVHKSLKHLTTTMSGLLLGAGFIGSFTSLPQVFIIMIYAAAIVVGGYKPAKSAFYAIKSRSLDMNVLMVSAAVGAALIGEWFEGATVVWLFALGNTLQSRSIERTRESIRNLFKLTPSEATVKIEGEWVRKHVEDIAVHDTILIKPGDKLPLDGKIISGVSSINQAPITGESMPVDKKAGDKVYAGTVNEHGSLEVQVTKLVKDTTIAKIIHLVEEAQEKKAPTQAFVDRFAKVYTPIVFGLALFIMIFPPLIGMGAWSEWLYKGLALLVVACPCALVISTPVAIVSAIGNAAKNGVLIKGGTFLEKAGSITAMAFDKTGTLTEGKPKVSHIFTVKGEEKEWLSIARTIEEHSTHPIAQAVLSYTEERSIPAKEGAAFESIAGKGAKAVINGVEYFAGNPAIYQEFNVSLKSIEQKMVDLQQEGHTLIIVGTRSDIFGVIAVADTIREITVQSIQKLNQAGMQEIVMLTGDNDGTAGKIARQTGVERYFAQLLPEDKVGVVEKLQKEGKRVAMVGDGINDAPALATADLGIAMGGAGTDTAMETAEIVLMADNLEKLPHTIDLSRRTLTIIKQNIWFSLLTKIAALSLIFPGFLTLWMAVLSDTGAALLVILNSLRLLNQK
ncbi:heavy metal translocating P-type ATPase [Halobacillus sp. A5]|uniref:heavy metal translocating P-type ATPase n=1 Tax=Halobacillus sp. A5 TaxID=2880263 RepID=UPI0020A65C93|nr:heavy metal translocating P-type ATPase [Halobacillus sp. A5]MCP3029438.1 cadmium-translocating P-type ATPase [Halobacillus sp. A5]